MEKKSRKIETLLNHPHSVPLREGNRPLIQPIYNSAKFTPSEDAPYTEQFLYGRISNPTTKQLENTLAELQKKDDCIVLSSGVAALSGTFLGLLKSGDHMISFRELYRPARTFIRDYLPGLGISSTFGSLARLEELERFIKKETKLIHFESPSNPTLQIADINFIVSLARKNGILVSMDGTFAGLHQHTQYDIDVMIQSLTKYGNGHGDVIAGSIAGKKNVIRQIRDFSVYLGAHLDPQAAYLIQRGLKTYNLRFERQVKNAKIIAEYLMSHPSIAWVRYPGLEKFKNRELASQQMQDHGAVIAFEINPEVADTAESFCHRLKLVQLAASLGSTESLICPTLNFFGLDLDKKEREEMGINQRTVRFSVGIENHLDIIDDLEFALSVKES
jgi:cystathionine beta-lyase/cystathionine gamma-synthase